MSAAATLSVPPRGGAKTSPSVMTAAIRAASPETNENSADNVAASSAMVTVADDVRHSQAYHDSYYGMKPRDPRLPRPLEPITNPTPSSHAAAASVRSPAAAAIHEHKKALANDTWALDSTEAPQQQQQRTGTRPPSPAQNNAQRSGYRDATVMGDPQRSLDSVPAGSATSTPMTQDLSRSRSPGHTHQPYSQNYTLEPQPYVQQTAFGVRRGMPMNTPTNDPIPKGILTPGTSPAMPSLSPYEAQNLQFSGAYGQIQNQNTAASVFAFPGAAQPQYYTQPMTGTQQLFFMPDPASYGMYSQQQPTIFAQPATSYYGIPQQQQQPIYAAAAQPQPQQQQSQLTPGQTQQVYAAARMSNDSFGVQQPQQIQQPSQVGERGGRTERRTNTRGGRQTGEPRAPQREPNPATSNLPKSAALQSLIDDVKVEWTMEELADHIVEFSMDHDGSRLVQRLVTDEASAARIFPEIQGEPTMILMTDVFGNYVIQRLFEVGSDEHRHFLAMSMKGSVLRLSLHAYGCRVVQKALQHCPPSQQRALAAELHGHVVECVRDQNGNHVIQKCIEVLPNEAQFIAEAFSGELPQLASHAYGCRVMQRLFERCPNNDVVLDRIVQETLRFTDALVNDQYGNYVIQHVLINGTHGWRHIVAMQLVSRFAQLSRTKFGSNVTEKLFEHSSDADRAMILHALIEDRDANGCCAFVYMMQDQFANYVVQKILDRATKPQQDAIIAAITPWVAEVKKYTFGKHIVARLEKSGLLPSSGGPQRTPPSPALLPHGNQQQQVGGRYTQPMNTTPPQPSVRAAAPMPVYAPSSFSGPASADYNSPSMVAQPYAAPQQQSRFTAGSVAYGGNPMPASNSSGFHDPAIAVVGAVKDGAVQRANFGTTYDQRGNGAPRGRRGY